MSWTDDQLDRLRSTMLQAKRAGAWISSVESRIVVDLIAAYRRMTMRTGWSGAPDGRLPTIGDSRRGGMTHLFVECRGVHCHARRRFSFDDLGLEDHVVFVEVPRHRRFRCVQCGCRTVSVMGDWPDPIEVQQRRTMGDHER